MARRKKNRLLRITLKRSLIDLHKKNKATLRALGLRKIGQSVIQKDNDAIRGMLRAVSGYIEFEEVQDK